MAKSALIHTKNIDPATLAPGPITIEAEVVQTENDPADLVDATGTVHGDGVLTSILTMPDTANDYPINPAQFATGDTVVIVGDSIAANNWGNGFYTAAGLAQADVVNEAASGTTLQSVPNRTGSWTPLKSSFAAKATGAAKKDRLIIAIGFNDARCSIDLNLVNVKQFTADYRTLILRALDDGYAPADITLVAPSHIALFGLKDDTDGDFSGQSEQNVEAYRVAVERVAKEFGTWFANPAPAMVAAGGLTTLGSDRIHPNATGSALITREILRARKFPANNVTAVSVTVANDYEVTATWTGDGEDAFETIFVKKANFSTVSRIVTQGSNETFTAVDTGDHEVWVKPEGGTFSLVGSVDITVAAFAYTFPIEDAILDNCTAVMSADGTRVEVSRSSSANQSISWDMSAIPLVDGEQYYLTWDSEKRGSPFFPRFATDPSMGGAFATGSPAAGRNLFTYTAGDDFVGFIVTPDAAAVNWSFLRPLIEEA